MNELSEETQVQINQIQFDEQQKLMGIIQSDKEYFFHFFDTVFIH